MGIVTDCGELRNFVVPDLLAKHLLDRLLQPPFRRNSNEGIGDDVEKARTAVERSEGKYGPLTLNIVALYCL